MTNHLENEARSVPVGRGIWPKKYGKTEGRTTICSLSRSGPLLTAVLLAGVKWQVFVGFNMVFE